MITYFKLSCKNGWRRNSSQASPHLFSNLSTTPSTQSLSRILFLEESDTRANSLIMNPTSSSRIHHQTIFLNLLFVFLSLTQSTLAVDDLSSNGSGSLNSTSKRATLANNSQKKITTGIPNTNLKTTLDGLRESGVFYTSKDLSSDFAFTSQNFNFINSNGSQNVDLQLNTSTAYQEMDFGECLWAVAEKIMLAVLTLVSSFSSTGTAMTDSSAWNLLQLKGGNSSMYSQTMDVSDLTVSYDGWNKLFLTYNAHLLSISICST